jgi:anti-sigma-K factor RskA
MNDSAREKMLDLLFAKATTGLSAEESEQLRELEKAFPELKEDNSFELAAAAIGLINLKTDEPMPSHLRAKILDDADKFFVSNKEEAADSGSSDSEAVQKTFAFEPKRSIWNTLGWLVAAAACIVLAINLWMTRGQPQVEYVQVPQQVTPTPAPNPAQQRQQLLASANDIVQRSWTEFNPKQPRNVQGDVVWSNSAQKGFIRFQNLPVNDKTKEAYQLWIFDETQKNPIDGGVFDADEAGEIVVPIDAKLEVKKPAMFAVTAEKPGGVVVSELGKVMAVAKIET